MAIQDNPQFLEPMTLAQKRGRLIRYVSVKFELAQGKCDVFNVLTTTRTDSSEEVAHYEKRQRMRGQRAEGELTRVCRVEFEGAAAVIDGYSLEI